MSRPYAVHGLPSGDSRRVLKPCKHVPRPPGAPADRGKGALQDAGHDACHGGQHHRQATSTTRTLPSRAASARCTVWVITLWVHWPLTLFKVSLFGIIQGGSPMTSVRAAGVPVAACPRCRLTAVPAVIGSGRTDSSLLYRRRGIPLRRGVHQRHHGLGAGRGACSRSGEPLPLALPRFIWHPAAWQLPFRQRHTGWKARDDASTTPAGMYSPHIPACCLLTLAVQSQPTPSPAPARLFLRPALRRPARCARCAPSPTATERWCLRWRWTPRTSSLCPVSASRVAHTATGWHLGPRGRREATGHSLRRAGGLAWGHVGGQRRQHGACRAWAGCAA